MSSIVAYEHNDVQKSARGKKKDGKNREMMDADHVRFLCHHCCADVFFRSGIIIVIMMFAKRLNEFIIYTSWHRVCPCFSNGIPVQGATVAQWVNRWNTDLTVLASSLARDEIFSTVNGVPLHTAFHYHPPIIL